MNEFEELIDVKHVVKHYFWTYLCIKFYGKSSNQILKS